MFKSVQYGHTKSYGTLLNYKQYKWKFREQKLHFKNSFNFGFN